MHVTIDLAPAHLNLDPDAMLGFSQQLADDIQHGLADDAWVAREEDLPADEQPRLGDIIRDKILAILDPGKLLETLNWLGQKFYGSTLELVYEDDDKKVRLKYQTDEQLQQQLSAIERLSRLKVNVVNEAV